MSILTQPPVFLHKRSWVSSSRVPVGTLPVGGHWAKEKKRKNYAGSENHSHIN
jgi:hypothetical protein